MIENLQSNSKTVSSIYINGEERYYGNDATSKYSKCPDSVFIRLNQFLGFDNSRFNFNPNNQNIENNNNNILNEEISTLMKISYLKENNILYDIKLNKERNSIIFNLNSENLFSNAENEKLVFSVEEIYAMIFRYIKSFSSKYLAKEVNEFIIAVPNFFGYKQRNSIIQSLNIANIKINNLITSGLSAGIYFALEKSFVNKDKNHVSYNIIFDMGSSYTQVSLFSYNSLLKIENKKTIEITNMKKIYETWDNTLGGKYFDMRIAELLSIKYKNSLKDKKNVYNNFEINNDLKNKSNINDSNYFDFLESNKKIYFKEDILISKFLYHAIKLKEILSANREHRFNLIIDNGSFIGNITRREFEEYSQDLFERIVNPIERILEISNKQINEIDSIQIIGGGVRIPKIKDILIEKYGSKKILTNLNGDEAVSMGAAYYNANLTLNNFIYKNKKVISYNNYPFNGDIKIRIKNLIDDELNDISENEKSLKKEFCGEKENFDDNYDILKKSKKKEYGKYYDSNYECLEKVNEERTIFAKDLNKENMKIIKFQNKIKSNIVIEIYEIFKETKHQNFQELNSLSKKETNIDYIELNSLIDRKKLNLDLIGFYKINNINKYLTSIKNEIAEILGYANDNNKNDIDYDKIPITLNIILSIDSLGILNLKAQFQYELNFYLNYNKTNNGEYKFFYSSKYMEKLDNKTLTEEFNHINTSKSFDRYSKNDKLNLKKKLKYQIGTAKKNEIKKKEILLDFNYSNSPLPMTKKEIIRSRVKINKLDENDENKRIFGEKLNCLENLIYTKIDLMKNTEYKKFFTKEEENKIFIILNQIKEEIFETNIEINPFFNMIINKNSNKKNFIFFNNKDKYKNDFNFNSEIIDEKEKLIKELFEEIDYAFENYKGRKSALDDYQFLFDNIQKERVIIESFENKINKRNYENTVDLNINIINYEKELNKIIEFFKKNVNQKFKKFENELGFKLEEQNILSLRDV